MAAALRLAARGLGNVWPNPAVGCLIVRDGRTVGTGWTQPSGRPHAETVALREAGALARGATAYVTLEPCSHHGRTPPCTDALIAAGIARVVIACPDPDGRVDGTGVSGLQEAGIEVATGCLQTEAERLNAGFLLHRTSGRPLVTLKLATTLDGRIATRAGESRWITGSQSRAWAHRLRASHDAILVGAGTVAADDPELTCRLPGLSAHSPVRAVLSSTASLPQQAAMRRFPGGPAVWVLHCTPDLRPPKAADGDNVRYEEVQQDGGGRVSPQDALARLAARGITRLLIEGGQAVATSFLRAGLVDRIAWFRAATVFGGDGLPALGSLDVEAIEGAPRFLRLELRQLDGDILESYAVQA